MSSTNVLSMEESDSFLDKKSTSTESTEDKRETWDSSRTFVLVLLGYAVGLGNVWRFPYLCYTYGGGAFLIPYFFFVVVAGIPMFFLEISLGQFTRLSAIEVWKIAPCMKGIGYGCALVNGFCGIYYITVLAWSFLYLFHSVMPGDLPWTTCDNWWNTVNCTAGLKSTVAVATEVAANASTTVGPMTSAVTSSIISNRASMPAAEFWKHYVLRQSAGLHDIGSLENWPMIFAFLVSWIFIYFCVFKGVRSSGKIVYISATAPYLMLLVLFIRGVTLPGAFKGISYLFRPDFQKLFMSETWVNAGSQIFYTYGICFTVLFAFGSYNPKNNNCYKQAIALVFSGSATSLFSSLVIFSILGHLSYTQDIRMEDVADQGPGLAFFVYPVGLSLLPAPKVWSFLFFATLVLVGVDTQFSGVEAIISVLIDLWPGLVKGRKYGRELLAGAVCLVLMIVGLPLLTQGGIYIFQLYNTYAASGISLLWLAMFESIAIGWVYGVDRFYDDIESMLGFRPHVYFKICYKFLIPGITCLPVHPKVNRPDSCRTMVYSTYDNPLQEVLIILFASTNYVVSVVPHLIRSAIFVFFCVNNRPLVVDDYVYPGWANGIGWSMSLVSMVCVPSGFLYHLATNNWKLKRGGSLEDLTNEEKKYASSDVVISTVDKSALEVGGNIELQLVASEEGLPLNMA